MDKFKICPYCGRRNPITALECEECETDLSTVRVMDEASNNRVESISAADTSDHTSAMVRICESCGFHNPANARKCSSCGEDISDIVPVDKNEQQKQRFILASCDGEYAYQLSPGETIIGREAAMSEYLSPKCFVSRRHARLVLQEGEVTLENLSQVNFTYVNNKKITNGTAELHDGDIIGLGGNEQNGKRQDNAAYFMMRIGSCI